VEQKNSKIYNKETMQTLSAYCSANNIEDIDDFIYKCFKQGFDIKKYGLLGKTLNEGEKHLKTGGIEEKQVEIEVIREIRVEVPVEVIKEVEKIIYTTDDTQVNELLLKIQQLEQEISTKTTEIGTIRQEFSTKTEEMENIFQNKMSKKDKELDELRRNLDIPVTNDKLNMLQQTIQNLNSEIRDLKNKNNDLTNKILDTSKIEKEVKARFHNGSNLNDNLYK